MVTCTDSCRWPTWVSSRIDESHAAIKQLVCHGSKNQTYLGLAAAVTSSVNPDVLSLNMTLLRKRHVFQELFPVSIECYCFEASSQGGTLGINAHSPCWRRRSKVQQPVRTRAMSQSFCPHKSTPLSEEMREENRTMMRDNLLSFSEDIQVSFGQTSKQNRERARDSAFQLEVPAKGRAIEERQNENPNGRIGWMG